MAGPRKRRPGWRWLALLTVVVAAAAGTGYWFHWSDVDKVSAQPTQPTAASSVPHPLPALPNVPIDYDKRAVAFLGNDGIITRAELGEYLIPRFGSEKLDKLVKRRVMERAVRAAGIEVTASEVEATLLEQLKELNLDREKFVTQVLKGYHMNLTEWREDTIRPRLMLQKLVRNQVRVSDEDLRNAFEATYGEQICVRVIAWPEEDRQAALDKYALLRDNEAAFSEAAGLQKNSAFAASKGKMRPFRRHQLAAPELEAEAFKLRPGQVSELLHIGKELMLMKCDQRIPADQSANFDAKREELLKAATERKTDDASKQCFQTLLTQASPKSLVDDNPKLLIDPNAKVLAYLWGNEPVTREELGEFLVQRFGGERLELLVNKRIIERACKAAEIEVSDADVEADLQAKLSAAQVSEAIFIKEYLNPQGKNLYEYKEDVLRESLRMNRLCREGLQAHEDEIKNAYDANYGEKVVCRIILWPEKELASAWKEYPDLRDDETKFNEKAKHQASNQLAAKGGLLEPFARFGTGDMVLEREAFNLQPGQVSAVIVTNQGPAMLRCISRLPAQTNVKMEDVHEKLRLLVIEAKMPKEIRERFKFLKAQANPRLLIGNPSRREDLKASVEQDRNSGSQIQRVSGTGR